MDSSRDELIDQLAREGLGGSVAIYMSAIAATLAVIALPVYFAVAPSIYDNPPPEPLDPLLQGPIVGSRVSTPMPLAHLKREVIVDPKLIAEVNRRAGPSRQQTVRSAPARERGPAVAELPERRERQGFFLFNLFGG